MKTLLNALNVVETRLTSAASGRNDYE